MKRKLSDVSQRSKVSRRDLKLSTFFPPGIAEFTMPKFSKIVTRDLACNSHKWIGAHLSITGGLDRAISSSSLINANACALFVRSQRRWNAPPLTTDTIDKFRNAIFEHSFDPRSQILPHGSYLINLGNPDNKKREVSYKGFLDELQRCEALGIGLYNLHPGSTCGECTALESINFIADAINKVHKETSFIKILLENMAGQGNVIGSTFEELGLIIEKIEQKARIGVCLDTCHAFSAGYDIRTPEGWESVLARFDNAIGIKSYLSAIHLNDSKGPLGCKKDRHENIGAGYIGLESFKFIMNDRRFDKIPLILETPSQDSASGAPNQTYFDEIQLLYSLIDRTE